MSRYKTYGLQTVAVNLPVNKGDSHRFNEMRFNLATNADATAATTFVVSLVCTEATYNVVLMSQPMVGIQDFIWKPYPPISIGPGETIRMVWDNDSASYKRWGLEVIYDE